MITTGINCLTSRFGTGMESCYPVEGLPTGFYLVPKGWSLNRTTDSFNSAYVDTQIQLGNFIPFLGVFEMTGTTPEPTTEESQSGITAVVRQGKTTFNAKFKKGLPFQAAAYSYNSNNQYDALIVYDTGYVKGVISPDGLTLKAVTVGMVNTNGYTENTGAASAETNMMFQVVDPLEYNQYAFLLTDLDFNPQSKNGITNMLLSTPDKVPASDASDNAITFPVVWRANEKFSPGASLTVANFKVTVNGTDATIDTVVYNSTTMKYTIALDTPATAGQVVIVYLWDTVNNREVARVGVTNPKFYQGQTPSVTTVA